MLFVGYRIARLGHDMLLKGVTGQFDFKTEFRGGKAALVSASPGIFFILMAVALISVSIFKESIVTSSTSAGNSPRVSDTTSQSTQHLSLPPELHKKSESP